IGTSLGIPDALNKALPTVDLFISNDKLKLTAPQGIDLKTLVPIEQLGLPEVISKYIPEIKIDNPQISVTKAENSGKNIDLSGTVAGLNLGLNYTNGKWTSKGIDDGGRLSVLDLITAFKTSKDNKQNFYNYIDYQLKGEANLGLTAKTSINGNPVFPSFNFDLAANFPIFNYGNKEQADKKGVDINLNNVGIDLGSFISDLIGPVLKEVNKIIEPVKPVIKLLNSDTKLFTELGIADAFDDNKDKKVTIFEVAKLLVPEEEKEKLEKSERFIKAVGDIVDTIALLSQIPADQSIIIDLGSFSLTDFKAGSKDKNKTADKLDTNSVETTKTVADPLKDATDTVNKQTDTATNSTDKTKATNNKSTSSFLSKIKSIEGLNFPILTNPIKAIDLLTGKTTDLIVYDIPDLDFKFDIESSFPVYGPVPIIKGVLGGSFEAKTDLKVGFDTAGINQWKNDDFQLSSIYKVFDGFYLSDWDEKGKDVNELTLKATIEAGLDVSVLVASASLRGGIEGIVGLDVVDIGENTGKSDGKIRGSEIISRIKTPWELFKLNGKVDVFLKGEAKVFWKTVWEKEFARFNLAKFTLSADGFTFSSKLSQSYIAGATIFLDTNFNNQWDEGEIKTVSNEYGKFDLDIPPEVDLNGDGEIGTNEAQLVGLGGFNTSSGLPSGALIALPDSQIVTPLTSLQARLVQSGLTKDAANNLIKDKLNLDLTASLETFDPLKSVGENYPLQAVNQNNDDGLNIYLAHIQVQALLNHSQALLDGLQTNPNNLLTAIDGLARFLQVSTDTENLVLTNAESVKTFFNFLLQQEQLTLTPEQLQTAAQITATGNQFLSQVKNIGASKSVKDALPVLASVKRVVQGTLSDYIQQLATAEQSPENIFATVKDALNQNYYLVDANGNAFGNRYVYVEAIIPENTDDINENDPTFDFLVELTQPAPDQGLTVIYSFSGTATLGEDYEVITSKLGELYIKPGETSGTIKVKLLDDDSNTNRETIAFNLQSVGEGYTIDPIGKVALVDIAYENPENNSVQGNDIIGGLGKDTIKGTAGDDLIEGYYGSDELHGLEGNDLILGGSGEDTINGGTGDDDLEGNFGKDILIGAEGDDFIDGSSGDDELIGGSGVDILLGAADNDILIGNTGNDQLEGEAGNDYLEGNEDNDWLSGGAGNDILIGGAGDDIKYGGDGADVFFFESPKDGFDTILDFNPNQGDKIQVSSTNFGLNNIDKFRFINGVLDFNGENLALVQNNGATYAYFSDLSEIIQIVEEPEELTEISPSDNSQPTTPENNSTANISIDNPQTTILDEIIKRGRIKFATSSAGSEFDFEFIRSLAVALFGDANKVEKVDTTFSKVFELVANGTVDIASQRSTHRLGRDTKLGIDFSPTFFYDYQAVVVRKNTNIQDITDLQSLTIGVVSNGLNNLQDLLNPEGIEFTPKLFGSLDELFAAYDNQEIDGISTDHYLIAEHLKRQNDFENHHFFDVEFSREPIALALPENDSQWADIVRWVNYVPIQAEEFGISSQNIDQIIAANTDDNPNNDSAPEIRRFLGLEEEIGAALGLPNNFAVNIIKQIGNYGEIFQRHFDDLERDAPKEPLRERNFTWIDGGLLYSPPFSGKSIESNLIENDNRNLLKDVLERGYLKIGLPNNNPGFAIQKENGEFDGFDVDLGKAIAAALFGDASKLEIKLQSFNDSFANTANGIVDVSAMSITHNIVRDASLGIDFSPTYLYTGQGILVRNDSAINNIPGLNGRKVGILAGSTALQNLEDAAIEFGAIIIPVEFATNDEMFAAYEKKEIDAVSTDQTILAARIPTFSNSEEHFILDEILSKEPLALITDENQSDWADVIRWVYNSLVLAEEYYITKDNIDQFIAENTDNNLENDDIYAIRQLLGLEGNIGEALGLPNDFVVKAIKAVGNYGEIYERHFDSDILYRENNDLASNYGLQYALPNNTTVAPTIQNATFAIDENSKKETEIGIIDASDPEKEALTFAIINGNIDPDQDNNPAFNLDPSTGKIIVNDKDDLDFETTPNFNLEVTATNVDGLSDRANITVNLNDITNSTFDTSENQNGIFTFNPEDPSKIKFTLTNNNTENVNEVGVFVVDDKNGTIDGKSPGSQGYLKAALQKAQIIFSAINNRPNGFDLEDIKKVIEIDSQTHLGFYLVSNGTTDTALAQLQATGTNNLPIFFSDSPNLQISEFSTNGFKLNWSDQAENSNFTSMELRVELTQDTPAPFTKLQTETQKELIDLTDITGQVSVNVEVHREAAFDNLIGFYQIADINGGIDTTGDGKADIFVGQEGYKQAALTNRITGLDLLKTDNQQTTTLNGTFKGETILASFIIVDGTIEQAINNSAETYFSFLGANSDGVDHIRLLGDNTFGYEDLPGGGDGDFNDMIVKINFPTV
ncbi:MAG: transporter substrate-binding domain-containing protein, partial [Cyanobacteria bacterium P01_D01_bin.116]